MNRAHAILLSLFAVYFVLNATASNAANDSRAGQLKYEPWAKLCIGKTCFVGVGARGACVPSGGGVVISSDPPKNTNLSVSFFTPRPIGALSVRIDRDDPIAMPDPTCSQYACSAKMQIDDAFVERLRRAQTIAIEATDASSRATTLSFSLAGFGEAYDGPGEQPKVFEENQKSLQEELERRKERDAPPPCVD